MNRPAVTCPGVPRSAAMCPGFTLIELMIALVILAILGMIAVPSYQGQAVQARRVDAQVALSQLAARQERYYTECNSYTTTVGGSFPGGLITCAAGGLGFATTASADGYYTLSVAAGPGALTIAQGFVATATPVSGGAQANDSACTTLTLDFNGTKSGSGSNPTKCWKK